MSEVKVNPGDSFEVALKKFNRKVQQDGILSRDTRREMNAPVIRQLHR
jgi:small subunit ribosomal protein S21